LTVVYVASLLEVCQPFVFFVFVFQSKQLSHAREMENLRAKAREEALEAAKQLEEV